MKEFYIAASSALGAAIIGAILTWWLAVRQEKKRVLEEQIQLLHAIKCELEEINELIEERAKQYLSEHPPVKQEIVYEIEDLCRYDFAFIRVSFPYMSIYESIGSDIGKIKDRELVKQIMWTYFEIKSMYENLKDLEVLGTRGFSLQFNDKYYYEGIKKVAMLHNNIKIFLVDNSRYTQTKIVETVESIAKRVSKLEKKVK